MCVLIVSTTFVWKISHFKKNLLRYYYKCTLFDFNETWIFWTDLRKKTPILNIMETRLVEVDLFLADERTDGQTDEASSRLSQFWDCA
jgi:hypothetical protein